MKKITDTPGLSKGLFVVTITYRDKDKVHTPSRPENTYTFGCCIKDIKTTIRIFYDFFDISDEKKGYIPFENIQINHMSDEEKIITALDKWESYYKD